ncbi:hypothetical protein EGM51_11835 [Verrucomicrobia bacterium S94]|nr:hypothetical protein EGM51_11835 [Verrucomicrobia bacterium S94]
MIKNLEKSPSTQKPKTDETGCRSFGQLKDWQIDRYRMAVDENMWYMGERLGRKVEWEEAEEDFLQNGYYGCAPKWRSQYCQSKCSYLANCKLGQLFTRKP